MSIFKACDVRGPYPDEVNEKNFYDIGRAIGGIIKSGEIIVGGDVRLSTGSLRIAFIDGLVHSGCSVKNIGTVPTPALYFARSYLGINSAAMITASHNPADYNGLKIILEELPITEQDLQHIRRVSESGDFVNQLGSTEEIDITEQYENYILEKAAPFFDGINRLPKVVVDCGNGCYSEIAPRLFSRLNIPRKKLFCEVDGAFPERSPNCADPKALSLLASMMTDEKADFGVAFDGDGDRIAFVDETGTILSSEQFISTMAIYGANVGKEDKVILDIKTGTAAIESIEETGARIIMERSGHTFIKTSMIRQNAAFGGEVSGHLFYRELNGADDGLYSALLMTSVVAKHGKLSNLISQLPTYPITPDLRIKVEHSSAILRRIAEAFDESMISRLDGVRVQFEDGWGLARASVTEPAITLRFEAKNKEKLLPVIERFLEPVQEIKDRVMRRITI